MALSVLCATIWFAPLCARAEFYRWTDARGQLRISNIPPQGVAIDGSLVPRYNPLSIESQQATLRARLKARDEALAATRVADQSVDEAGAESEEARSK